MLIDLARNDIGCVGKPKSVAAKIHAHRALRERDAYRLGTSTTQKRAIRTPLSGAGSIFPAGTFSGTLKIRAIKIIAELESYRLNAYGGGIGFFILTAMRKWRF